jgi:hypothetical protein
MRNSTEQDRPLPAMKNNWLAVEVIHQRFVVAEETSKVCDERQQSTLYNHPPHKAARPPSRSASGHDEGFRTVATHGLVSTYAISRKEGPTHGQLWEGRAVCQNFLGKIAEGQA